MSNAAFNAYGVHITCADGTPIDLALLSPLIVSTTALLRQIADAGGPRIAQHRIEKHIHNLPLASIDGVPVLCGFLCEATSDPHETNQLVKARRIELARLFTKLMTSRSPPSAQFAGNTTAIRAIFLLFAAFETAQLFAVAGCSRRTLNGYKFSAHQLRVREHNGGITSEVIMSAAAALHRDQTLH